MFQSRIQGLILSLLVLLLHHWECSKLSMGKSEEGIISPLECRGELQDISNFSLRELYAFFSRPIFHTHYFLCFSAESVRLAQLSGWVWRTTE